MIKHSSYFDFFPYPSFRASQENHIQSIEKATRAQKNVLVVAPNGTGKTVMALSALLPVAFERGLKIIYMCRTHAQNARVIRELERINSSIPPHVFNISGLSIRGRNEMCLNSSLLRIKASPSEAMALCSELRAGKNLRLLQKGGKNKG